MLRRESRFSLMVLATVCSFRLAEAGALLFGEVEDVGGDGGGETGGGGKEDELGTDDEGGAVEGCAGSIRFENGLSPGAET
jgi:hypothetical protein